jgi:pimeloyl-ACP methyl ester carboxylesterase
VKEMMHPKSAVAQTRLGRKAFVTTTTQRPGTLRQDEQRTARNGMRIPFSLSQTAILRAAGSVINHYLNQRNNIMERKSAVWLYTILFTAGLLAMLANGCSDDGPIDNAAEPQVRYADITHAKIAYKVYGSGDPLVMCIGYATNMDLWSTEAVTILQKKYKVIVFDYRGMGYSTNTDTSITIQSLAEDVNELLTALNINKAHVLGWSMGGYVAQMFAIAHPEKVDKLILYATNCGDTLTINPSQEIINILSNPAATALERLGTLFPDDWLATHPEPWKYLPDAKEPYIPAAIGLQYFAVQGWLRPGGGSAGRLHALKMPVLLLCGNKDKVVPCENSSFLADSIPTAALIKVPDCGHGMMYQLPATFANYILAFLNN